jgi:DNA-binding MarR family transcriptional regulator
MSPDQPARRPIGWWLKEADAQLEQAFDRAFATAGRTRREWQVLSTLAESPTPQPHGTSIDALVAALAPFASSGDVRGLVDALVARGEVTLADGTLRLTEGGARAHAQLATAVGQVRRRVAAALSTEEYDALIALLTRLVGAVRGEEPPQR